MTSMSAKSCQGQRNRNKNQVTSYIAETFSLSATGRPEQPLAQPHILKPPHHVLQQPLSVKNLYASIYYPN